MLVPNTNTRARCTGDDESAPKTRDSTLLLTQAGFTTAVDRRFTPSPGTQGRTDKNLCRCFGAPARRVFPDHLITQAGFSESGEVSPVCPQAITKRSELVLPFLGRAWFSRLSFCVDMMLALGAMCVAEFSPQTLSSTGLDADMEKLNEYIQADKTNEQSVETLYADLQHRFSVMKVRMDTGARSHTQVHAFRCARGPFPKQTISQPRRRRISQERKRTAAPCAMN